MCITATGQGATLKKVATPLADEDQALAVAATPVTPGPCITCAWCGHTFPDSEDCQHEQYVVVKKKNAAAKQEANNRDESNVCSGGEPAAGSDYEDTITKGTMNKAASSVLMDNTVRGQHG